MMMTRLHIDWLGQDKIRGFLTRHYTGKFSDWSRMASDWLILTWSRVWPPPRPLPASWPVRGRGGRCRGQTRRSSQPPWTGPARWCRCACCQTSWAYLAFNVHFQLSSAIHGSHHYEGVVLMLWMVAGECMSESHMMHDDIIPYHPTLTPKQIPSRGKPQYVDCGRMLVPCSLFSKANQFMFQDLQDQYACSLSKL